MISLRVSLLLAMVSAIAASSSNMRGSKSRLLQKVANGELPPDAELIALDDDSVTDSPEAQLVTELSNTIRGSKGHFSSAPASKHELNSEEVNVLEDFWNGNHAVELHEVERIVGGAKTVANEVGFFGWILNKDRQFVRNQWRDVWKGSGCGCTLIGNDLCATAAHCVAPSSRAGMSDGVYVGANEPGTSGNGGSRWEFRTIKRIVYHESYKQSTTENDIALLWLTSKVSILPAPISFDDVSDGTKMYAAGFGRTSEGGEHSTSLLKVGVDKVDKAECDQMYNGRIRDGMMCAASPGKDSCKGDSGGPLLELKEDSYYLRGIISWGTGCAREDKPGVYADIQFYQKWLEDKACLTDAPYPFCEKYRGPLNAVATGTVPKSIQAPIAAHAQSAKVVSQPATQTTSSSSTSSSTTASSTSTSASTTSTTSSSGSGSSGSCAEQNDDNKVFYTINGRKRGFKCKQVTPKHPACRTTLDAATLCPINCSAECYGS